MRLKICCKVGQLGTQQTTSCGMKEVYEWLKYGIYATWSISKNSHMHTSAIGKWSTTSHHHVSITAWIAWYSSSLVSSKGSKKDKSKANHDGNGQKRGKCEKKTVLRFPNANSAVSWLLYPYTHVQYWYYRYETKSPTKILMGWPTPSNGSVLFGSFEISNFEKMTFFSDVYSMLEQWFWCTLASHWHHQQ